MPNEQANGVGEGEATTRAINAEPWEPMPGMVKRQCPDCRCLVRRQAGQLIEPRCSDCVDKAACAWAPALTRAELITEIAASNPHLRQEDAELIVATIFEQITAALARGERVELRGFGAFTVKQRNARIGRNPRTGETVQVHDKTVPFFKAQVQDTCKKWSQEHRAPKSHFATVSWHTTAG